MAAKKKAAKAGTAAMALKNSQYVQRIAEDEDLRANLVQAYESGRSAANRLSNGKSPTSAVFDDKKLQRDISQAAVAVRDAAVALRGKPQKRKGGFRRLVLLALIGAGIALVVSEGLRKKVLDTLFGAEEEFEYSSTTTAPPAPAPAAAG